MVAKCVQGTGLVATWKLVGRVPFLPVYYWSMINGNRIQLQDIVVKSCRQEVFRVQDTTIQSCGAV